MEKALQIVAHDSPRPTNLYARSSNEVIPARVGQCAVKGVLILAGAKPAR